MKYKIYNAEFIAWARDYEGRKFHACFCDPPYGLEFMGKEWDSFRTRRKDKRSWKSEAEKKGAIHGKNIPHLYHAGIGYQKSVKSWGKALLKLLYPGALVFMFGGTRTWHRLAAGMEDAGFELWDTIMWLHGQGFPKAQAIDALIDKKQGRKREIVGHRILGGNAAIPTKLKGGTYSVATGLSENIEVPITASSDKLSASWSGHKTCALKPAWEPILCFRAPDNGKTYAELALKYGSGCLNVDKGRIKINIGDKCIGGKFSANNRGEVVNYAAGGYDGTQHKNTIGRYPANLCFDEETAAMKSEFRFFYTAKAPTYERNEGLENNKAIFSPTMGDGIGGKEHNPETATRKHNYHPTVKPVSLNKWLASMLLPAESVKHRRLLVPFSGSGSEMIGALRAGWGQVIGVEMNKDYCRLAKDRLKYWKKYKPVWKSLI